MLPSVPILVLSTSGTLCIENIFCFMHHLIWNITILKIIIHFIISSSYANILASVCINFWGCVLPLVPKSNIASVYIWYYLWFPKVTLHLCKYGSLPLVVFGCIAVTYLIFPLYMCMQMIYKFKILFFYTLDITMDLNWLGKRKKVSNNFLIR